MVCNLKNVQHTNLILTTNSGYCGGTLYLLEFVEIVEKSSIFFDLEKFLKSIQISQVSWKLSAIPENFRIPLQLQDFVCIKC